jgi:hypothetical protein
MKTIKKATAFLSAAAICALMLFGTSTQAKIPPGEGLRQLTQCAIYNGNTVTQYGNTCDGKGNGCTPNPCG